MIKISVSLAAVILVCSFSANAAQTTYTFSTTVSSFDPTSSSFPGSLSAISAGDSVTGTLSCDSASAAVANPFSGIRAEATLYNLNNFSFTVDIGGVIFDSWSGTPAAFVWNDYSSGNDGLVFQNLAPFGSPFFEIGNISLPSETFSDETLPSGAITGPMLFNLGQFDQSGFSIWVESAPFRLTQDVVPVPAAAWLFGSGLLGLIGIARRKKS